MSTYNPDTLPATRAADIKALAMMLDYAILEGAELRLPLFVHLLKMARLELGNGADYEAASLLPPGSLMRETLRQSERAGS